MKRQSSSDSRVACCVTLLFGVPLFFLTRVLPPSSQSSWSRGAVTSAAMSRKREALTLVKKEFISKKKLFTDIEEKKVQRKLTSYFKVAE